MDKEKQSNLPHTPQDNQNVRSASSKDPETFASTGDRSGDKKNVNR